MTHEEIAELIRNTKTAFDELERRREEQLLFRDTVNRLKAENYELRAMVRQALKET